MRKNSLKYLAVILLLFGFVVSFSQSKADTADPRYKGEQLVDENDIAILFTNDVHNAYMHELNKDNSVKCLGYSSVAWMKKKVENITKNTLLVDNGDSMQGGLIGIVSKGSYIVELMNKSGYDYVTFGNHDCDFGMDVFMDYVGKNPDYTGVKANYNYLACNFKHIPTNKQVFPTYAINSYEVDGKKVKVALVGICTPENLFKSKPSFFKNENGEFVYDFGQHTDGTHLYEYVQDAVDSAKKDGADYVVAMAHTGTDEISVPFDSYSVIKNTSGIDAYLDGHSHSTIESELVKNKEGKDVVLSSTGEKLSDLGELVIDDDEKTITTSLIKNIDKEDEDVKELAQKITETFSEETRKVIAKTDVNLIVNATIPYAGQEAGYYRFVRNQETNLADLVTDSYVNQVEEADVAIVNAGSIRANLLKGDISFGDILSVTPFGNQLCFAELTGRQILDCLEMGARDAGKGTSDNGAFCQVSGMSYDIDCTYPSNVVLDVNGAFTKVDGDYRVKNVKIKGKPLDLNAKYKTVLSTYFAIEQGDGMSMLKGANVISADRGEDFEANINYICNKKNGVIGKDSIYANEYGEGRIRVITEKGKDYFNVLRGFNSIKIDGSYDDNIKGKNDANAKNGNNSANVSPSKKTDNLVKKLKVQKITSKKKISIKKKSLKKKSIKINLKAKAKGKAKLSYKVISYPKKMKKYIKVSSKGIITLKKGAKAGCYKIKIVAKKTKSYKSAKKTVKLLVI